MSILLGVIVLFALLTLAIAIVQARAFLRVAPAGERLGSFMPLGWWKFRQLEAKAGPAAAAPLNIYKRAVVAFVVFLLLGLILSGWSMNRQASTTQAVTVSDIASPVSFSDLRRVATMPGAPNLES